MGRAVAVALGERGWSVGLIARGEAGLKAAVAEVEAAGGRALALPADVARGGGDAPPPQPTCGSTPSARSS